tara:strand:- start:227 stop:409 length:183 start_codon:yes stop_codon:yes gene_type:complete
MKSKWMECDTLIRDLLDITDEVTILRDAIRYIENKNSTLVKEAFNYANDKRDREWYEIQR